jgi:hypothetical protein
VFDESNGSMHLIIAISTKIHIAIDALQFRLHFASIALSFPSLPVPSDNRIDLRTVSNALFIYWDCPSALTGRFLLYFLFAGRANEGLATSCKQRTHLIGLAELAS